MFCEPDVDWGNYDFSFFLGRSNTLKCPKMASLHQQPFDATIRYVERWKEPQTNKGVSWSTSGFIDSDMITLSKWYRYKYYYHNRIHLRFPNWKKHKINFTEEWVLLNMPIRRMLQQHVCVLGTKYRAEDENPLFIWSEQQVKYI